MMKTRHSVHFMIHEVIINDKWRYATVGRLNGVVSFVRVFEELSYVTSRFLVMRQG